MTAAPIKLLFLASEALPLCRTGGLGDVAGALPVALAEGGAVDVTLVLPLHRAVRARAAALGLELVDTEVNVAVPLFGRPHGARIREVRGAPVRTLLVDAPRFFDRDGLYGHGDDFARYAFFTRAALEGGLRVVGDVDVVHAHDWMTALAPAYLRHRLADRAPSTRSVFTIHNLAHQGVAPKELLPAIDLDWSLFSVDGLEFWDQLNPMKGAVTWADAVTTVSPTYAREILTPAFGQGLDGHLRHHRGKVSGVINGLDVASWDPSCDPALAANYGAENPAGKAACRAALEDRFGLEGEGPIAGVVARFAEQKGLDLVHDVAADWARQGRLVVLGTGDRGLEDRFRKLAADLPGRVGVHVGFDDALARQIVAGSDLLLVPSRFEPCGLTQLQGLRYGTIPVVHATGGLRDTVHDPGDAALRAGRGNGFVFGHPSADALLASLLRAHALWSEPAAWSALQQRAFARDSRWTAPATRYVALYRRLLNRGSHRGSDRGSDRGSEHASA